MYLSVDKGKIVLGEYHTTTEKLIEATVCHVDGRARFINLRINGEFVATIRVEEGVCISFQKYKSIRFNGNDVVLEF